MMQLLDKKAGCYGCGACQAVCSAEAITMIPDAEGFLYPVINPARCVDCGRCSSVCPAKQPVEPLEGHGYAVRCNEPELLKKSTSGGAFSLLAEQVLGEGGLVCGAVFDQNFKVCHVLSEDIAPMRKSKYIQSDLTGVYAAIREALKTGRQVLFTGTPCQCDGMRRYFGPDETGLVLAAVVCRGVQSPGLWQDYIAHISGGKKLETYCFRDKRIGDDGHTVAYTVDGQEQAVSMLSDPFSRLYMKCLTLRPSCYQCPYTRWELPFDLTIGDFWGIEKYHPQWADGMGTSLVIARTAAGKALVEKIRTNGQVIESSREAAEQTALREPARESILRKLLFRDYAKKSEDGSCDIPLILKKYGG